MAVVLYVSEIRLGMTRGSSPLAFTLVGCILNLTNDST